MQSKIYTICPSCEQPFNLANRAPVLHSCCGGSSCKTCWLKMFNVNGRFYCYHECDEPNTENAAKPRINPLIKREIDQVLPLEIKCDKHPKERINGYSMEDKVLLCPKCPKVVDKRRYTMLDYSTFEGCCHTLLQLMKARMEEIKDSMATMNAILKQEAQPTGS